MISKLIKKIIGNKDDKRVSDNNTITGNNLTEKVKELNIDLMFKKSFIHLESAYQHQGVVIRRATDEKRLGLGEALKSFIKTEKDEMLSLAIMYQNVEGGKPLQDVIKEKDEIWNYDLFATGNETILVLATKSRNVIMTITGLGGAENFNYMRLTVMFPDNAAEDDCESLKTRNASVATSCIISHCDNPNSTLFKDYEKIEKAAENKITSKESLDELEKEYLYGKYEFKSDYYYGYGKWLFEQNRYYDACVTLKRLFNFLRISLSKQSEDELKTYYEISNIIGVCLSKMKRYDEAAYYFNQGLSGAKVDGQNSLGDCIEKIRNSEGDGSKKDFGEQYDGTITLGYMLDAIMRIKEKNLMPCMFVYNLKDACFEERVDNTQSICDFALNTEDAKDRVFVLSRTFANYLTKDEEDKSILCNHAPLIVATHSIKGKNSNAVMRVDVTNCNFHYDDDKRECVEYNNPVISTFCVGISEEKNYSIVEDDFAEGLCRVSELVDEHRMLEGYKMAKWIFVHSSRLLLNGATLSPKTEEMMWNIFYDASYIVGYCLMEINQMNRAACYLRMASDSGSGVHIMEFVNFLANTNDPQALPIIDHFINKTTKPVERDEVEGWNNFMAFLKRRKAYCLIDLSEYQEAKALLSQLVSDPLCSEFAKGELEYLKSLGV